MARGLAGTRLTQRAQNRTHDFRLDRGKILRFRFIGVRPESAAAGHLDQLSVDPQLGSRLANAALDHRADALACDAGRREYVQSFDSRQLVRELLSEGRAEGFCTEVGEWQDGDVRELPDGAFDEARTREVQRHRPQNKGCDERNGHPTRFFAGPDARCDFHWKGLYRDSRRPKRGGCFPAVVTMKAK